MNNRDAIILAGGLGTRLRSIVSDMPKSMAPIAGRPFLEYQLDYLEGWGINKVILALGYKANVIQEHFKDQYKGIAIEYVIEEEPLGTGGGIKKAFGKVTEPYAFIFNGDTYFDVNLKRVNDFLRIKEANCVISLRHVEDVSRYGSVLINSDFRIINFREKGQESGIGFINGGVYLISKRYFESFDLPEVFSIEKDFFQKHFESEELYGIRCFSDFLDIGTPDDYQRAQTELPNYGY